MSTDETVTQPVTYTFDVATIATIKVTTDAGEAAAREAVNAIDAISVTATSDELDLTADVAAGTGYDVTTVAPRSRAYLVYAVDADGQEAPVTDDGGIPEPITGDWRRPLAGELAGAEAALDGDSNDAEHDALYGLAETVRAALGATS